MSNGKTDKTLPVIGRIERVDIPEWDLYELDAKIDTGAYTSSLHCHHIETTKKNNKQYVRFNLLDPSHGAYDEKLIELPVFKTKSVKSSNGQSEDRFIIKTTIILAGKKIKAQLSLTDRSEMKYPVLIGRKLLNKKFLVDVSRKYS